MQRDEEPSGPGQRAGNEKRNERQPRRRDPEQAGDVRVFRHRPERPSDRGALDQEAEQRHEPHRRADDDELHLTDREDAEIEALTEIFVRKLIGIGAPDVGRHVLQDDRHADGAQHRRHERRVAQRLVGDLLDQQRQQAAREHCRDQRDRDRIARDENGEPDVGPDHEQFGNREVQDAEHAHHEREGQRHERIRSAERQAIDDLLEEHQGRCTARVWTNKKGSPCGRALARLPVLSILCRRANCTRAPSTTKPPSHPARCRRPSRRRRPC